MGEIRINDEVYGTSATGVDLDGVSELFYGSVAEREALAKAITDKGVATSAADTLTIMAENVKQVPVGGTAVANTIAKGKTAWANGQFITGTYDLPQSDSYKTTYYMYSGTTYDHSYTFETPFSKVPNVIMDARYMKTSEEGYAHCWVTEVTKTGFKAKVKCTLNAGYTYYNIRWIAWV